MKTARTIVVLYLQHPNTGGGARTWVNMLEQPTTRELPHHLQMFQQGWEETSEYEHASSRNMCIPLTDQPQPQPHTHPTSRTPLSHANCRSPQTTWPWLDMWRVNRVMSAGTEMLQILSQSLESVVLFGVQWSLIKTFQDGAATVWLFLIPFALCSCT